MKNIWFILSSSSLKKIYDERLITMTRSSFSFLGIVKFTRMDSSEGWTYMISIWYPLQDFVKIKRYSLEITRKMKVKHLLYRQHVALEHETLLLLVSGLGYSHLVTFPPGFGWSIFASYLTIPLFHHDLYSYVDSNVATLRSHVTNMFKRSPICILLPIHYLTFCHSLGSYSFIPLYSLFRVND